MMMPNFELPIYVPVLFVLTVLATLLIFYWTLRNSTEPTVTSKVNAIMLMLLIWMLVPTGLALTGFIHDFDAIPPRFPLVIVPPMICILILFLTHKGRTFIDSLPLKQLTYLSVIRVPVEITLWFLFLGHVIPELMTFEGRNFDILAGLTAPLIAYFGYVKLKLSKTVLLIWNIAGVLLLINIVVLALLSVPLPIQQFAFDQPNYGVTIFPYVLLPGIIVPLVFFSHFVSIRKLVRGMNS